MFNNGKYQTAADKQRLFKQWQKFLESGLSETHFTRDIYQNLSLYWGFIAHFNREGFYIARFDKANGRLSTLEQMANPSRWVFSDDNCSGNGDLHRAMHQTLMEHFPKLMEQAKLMREKELLDVIAQAREELRVNFPKSTAC